MLKKIKKHPISANHLHKTGDYTRSVPVNRGNGFRQRGTYDNFPQTPRNDRVTKMTDSSECLYLGPFPEATNPTLCFITWDYKWFQTRLQCFQTRLQCFPDKIYSLSDENRHKNTCLFFLLFLKKFIKNHFSLVVSREWTNFALQNEINTTITWKVNLDASALALTAQGGSTISLRWGLWNCNTNLCCKVQVQTIITMAHLELSRVIISSLMSNNGNLPQRLFIVYF